MSSTLSHSPLKKLLLLSGILAAGAAVLLARPTPSYAQYYYISPNFSLNRSGDIYPGTSLQANGSVANYSYYPYSGTISGTYQLRIENGGWFDWVGAGSVANLSAWETKSFNPYGWTAGSADSVKYFFRLCVDASDGRHCSGYTWVRVVNPPPPSYDISVSYGSGGAASCSGCGSSVTQGSSVTAAAGAYSGYQFSNWSWSGSSNPCSSAGSSCTFSASESGALTANFRAITYTLSVSKSGSGYVSGGGIDCGGTCSVSLSQGTSVTLSASPSDGYYFSGWSGCDSTSGSSCSLTMSTSGRGVSASFTQYIASANLSAAASVSYNGGSYLTWTSDNTSSCSLTNFGSVPTSNSSLNYWTGNLTSDTTFTLSCTPISGAAGTPSDSVTVAVKPSNPSVSASTGSCGGNVNLSYGSASLATSYTLYRDSGSGFSQTASASSVSGLPSSQGELSSGTTYRYQLQATNSSGSTWSSVSSASASGSCFDYSLSNTGNLTVTQGQSGANTITATLANGSTQNVTLSVSGLPSGVTASFGTNPVNPTGASTLTLSVSGSAVAGSYPITVSGSPLGKSTSLTLLVVQPVLSVSKSGSGTVTGAGITCGTGGNDCTETLNYGASASLSATPDSGYSFGGWAGECSGTGGCSLIMNSAKSVTANFTLQSSGPGGGYTQTSHIICHPSYGGCGTCGTGPYSKVSCPIPAHLSLSSPSQSATYSPGQTFRFSGRFTRDFGSYEVKLTLGGNTQTFGTNLGTKSLDPTFDYGPLTMPLSSGRHRLAFEVFWIAGHSGWTESSQGYVDVEVLDPRLSPAVLFPHAQPGDCGGKVRVTWTPWTGDSRVAGYVLYRLDGDYNLLSNPDAYLIIKIPGATSGGYIDTVPKPGTSYWYAVMAATSAQMSDSYLGNVRISTANSSDVLIGTPNATRAPFQRVGFPGAVPFGEFGAVISPNVVSAVSSSPCAPPPPTCRLSYQCETDAKVSSIPYHKSNTVTWGKVTGASGYRVYRSKWNAQQYEKVADITDPNNTIWVDGPYLQSSNYLAFDAYYKVSAYNAGGESATCAEIFQEGYADACPVGSNPDLTCPSPISVSGTPLGDGFKSGQPLTLSGGSVKNDFKRTTVSPINSIYQVSTDGGATYQDIAGSVQSVTGGLTIGESKAIPSYQYATALITSGSDRTLHFRAKVDYDNRVSPEADESNNVCPTGSAKLKMEQPNLTASQPKANNQTSGTFHIGTALSLTGLINNIGTGATPTGTFNNLFNIAKSDGSAAGGTWNSPATVAPDPKTTLSAGEIGRPVSSASWTPTVVGTYNLKLKADTDGQVTESNETDNESPATAFAVVDFNVALSPNPVRIFQTCPVTFTASGTTVPSGGTIAFSPPSCGVIGVKASPETLPAGGGTFTCIYPLPTSSSAGISGTYFGKTKTASAPVTVVAAVPKVALYISDAGGNCFGEAKSVKQIINGSKARLCWRVDPIDCKKTP
jgi:hypothetical protein